MPAANSMPPRPHNPFGPFIIIIPETVIIMSPAANKSAK